MRKLNNLAQAIEEEGVTLRQLRLLSILHIPRNADDVEKLIKMDRVTLCRMQKKRSDLIKREDVEPVPRRRGKLPAIYSLTDKGASFVKALNEMIEE